jgi:deoxyribonuclease V
MSTSPFLAPEQSDHDSLRALQTEWAQQVIRRDAYSNPLRTVAGLDVSDEDEGNTLRACAVLLDACSLDVLDQQTVRLPAPMPAISGLLGFRVMPALLEAVSKLHARPDLALLQGHGYAHPRRFGLAAHFGIASGLPSIGVAEAILVGETRMALHEMRGAFTPLRNGKDQIGWLLRSKPGSLPLVVSPGHKVAMASAPELVMRYTRAHRLPEPLRHIADPANVVYRHPLPTT